MKLLVPKNHLSWSAISLFKRDPKKYIKQYIYGEEGFQNSRMAFGSKAALAMETDEETDDDLLNMMVKLIPKYEKVEHEIEVLFKSQHGEVNLLGKLDTFQPKTLNFRDLKTGTAKWTQGKAEKLGQLTHYASIIWLKYKKLPKEIWLDWAETEEKEDEIKLTGHIESFKVKKTVSEILTYLAEAGRIAKEIDKIYRQEFKNLT